MNAINQIRRDILNTAYKSKEGHLGPSFSVVEILYSILKYKRGQDYLILSKGHASLALYAVMKNFGILTQEELDSFCQKGSTLCGHPDRVKLPSVVASTGSLGHGLPIAVGLALGLKTQGRDSKVYVVIGDGEANEGSIWEAASIAAHNKLDNLICFVDSNHSSDRSLPINIPGVFSAFGWSVDNIWGHNLYDLRITLSTAYSRKPVCIVCETTKGFGVSFMENNPEWHHRIMTEDEYNRAMQELEKDAF